MRSPRIVNLPTSDQKSGWPWTEEGFRPSNVRSDDSPWPSITVVTPSYNQAAFLEETMRSVLLQAYPNLKYVVVDGESTDGSIDIIRKYESHLSRWISENDRGAADAIRKGFSGSNSDILGWLNADDLYLPDTLFRVAAGFKEGVDVVYGNTYWIDSTGRRLGERRQTPFTSMGYLYGGADLQQPATFWRRALFEECGGMDPTFSFAFDTDLFCRFATRGARFHQIRSFVASFRIHEKAKSATEQEQCAMDLRRIRKTHLSHSFNSLPSISIRVIARARRFLWYLWQGDLFWLLGRIPDRIRSRHSQEIVGPRSKSL